MTEEEQQAIEKAAEKASNELRLYTSKYDFLRGFLAGAKALDEMRKPIGQVKELLEAAKYFRDAWNCDYSKITAKTEDVIKHNNAITNAENQSK